MASGNVINKSYEEIQQNLYFTITEDNIDNFMHIYKDEYSSGSQPFTNFKNFMYNLSHEAVGANKDEISLDNQLNLDDEAGYNSAMSLSEKEPLYKKYAIKVYYGTSRYNSYKSKLNIEKELRRILVELNLTSNEWIEDLGLFPEELEITEGNTPLTNEFIIINDELPEMFKNGNKRWFYYKALNYDKFSLTEVKYNDILYNKDACKRNS